MKKLLILLSVLMINACTTKYILMDENGNPVKDDYYAKNTVNTQETVVADNQYDETLTDGLISGNDVFVVNEQTDSVTYQYKNVRVDEISPLASLYCADISYGGSPYLREVTMFHNGFMRATFDCVNIAI
jgi:hypothetical protein